MPTKPAIKDFLKSFPQAVAQLPGAMVSAASTIGGVIDKYQQGQKQQAQKVAAIGNLQNLKTPQGRTQVVQGLKAMTPMMGMTSPVAEGLPQASQAAIQQLDQALTQADTLGHLTKNLEQDMVIPAGSSIKDFILNFMSKAK